jgi:transposase
MSHHDLTTDGWFETYFEDRLAQIEHDLHVWAIRVYFLEDRGTHDAIMQKVRIALWRRFSENPEEWAALPRERWLAYAKETFRWGVTGFHRDGIKWLGMVASDMDCMAEGRDINDDEALSMLYTDHTEGGRFAYPREIRLADLRIDLEAAIARGMRRLCTTQRRDMPKLIADLLEGYTLDETCARYGWTRNRGVTLMRKLRTVFYEEMSGEKKIGYLGSHHPLTDTEKQRIKELYATGLSYRKVGALVGRSPSAVESVCKRYPPELVSQVRDLRKQGLSFAEIARRVGRGKSYIAWLANAELSEGADWPHNRGGDDLALVPIAG